MAAAQGDTKFFFVHIMKVGGFSLSWMIRQDVLGVSQVFPNRFDPDVYVAGMEYHRIIDIPEGRRREIRLFSGHYPYAAKSVMGDVKTFALFRDPVERAISMMKHLVQKLPAYKGMSLEEAFDDPPTFSTYLDNVQLRAFSIPDIEHGRSMFDVESLPPLLSFEQALQNVDGLDAILLTEDYEDSVRMLGTKFGWTFRNPLRLNESKPAEVSESLRARVADRMGPDREFFDAVKKKYYARKEALLANGPLPSFSDEED